MTRFELVTSSLPRKRSTPELHRPAVFKSGRRDSNSRRSAWKADALPTELLPLISFVSVCGESRIRTCEGVHQQIYSLPSLAAWVSPQHWSRWRDSNPRPADYKSAALANWATSANVGTLKKELFLFPKYELGMQIYETFFDYKVFFQKNITFFFLLKENTLFQNK